MFWIFVGIASLDDSNNYAKHIYYEEIKIKQTLSYILFCCVKGFFTAVNSF